MPSRPHSLLNAALKKTMISTKMYWNTLSATLWKKPRMMGGRAKNMNRQKRMHFTASQTQKTASPEPVNVPEIPASTSSEPSTASIVAPTLMVTLMWRMRP